MKKLKNILICSMLLVILCACGAGKHSDQVVETVENESSTYTTEAERDYPEDRAQMDVTSETTKETEVVIETTNEATEPKDVGGGSIGTTNEATEPKDVVDETIGTTNEATEPKNVDDENNENTNEEDTGFNDEAGGAGGANELEERG